MEPCFRPGWARLGVGSCHFICSADNIAVPGRCCVKMIFEDKLPIWYHLLHILKLLELEPKVWLHGGTRVRHFT